MKTTFKQFLEDISIDDGAYSKEASDVAVKGVEQIVSTKWKPVPLKSPFPINGFSVKYNKRKTASWFNGNTYDIALLDNKTDAIAVHIECSKREYTVPGGNIIGLETEQLSSNITYRGKGLVVALYQTLVSNGQNVFSASLQTKGGASVWTRLTQQTDGTVFGVVPIGDMEKKHPEVRSLVDEYDFVLVHGDLDKIAKCVYDAGDAFWFITRNPGNLMRRAVKV